MIGSESAISCFRRAAAAEQQIDHARGKIKMGGAVQGGKGPPLHRRALQEVERAEINRPKGSKAEGAIWFRRRQKTVSIVFRAELTAVDEPAACHSGSSMGSSPEAAVPAYRRLRLPRKRSQVLGADLNRSESRIAETMMLSIHLAPEVLEPIRRQLSVAHRVLDVLVAEPSL